MNQYIYVIIRSFESRAYDSGHLLKHLMLAKDRQVWGTWVGDEGLQIGHQAAKILVVS